MEKQFSLSDKALELFTEYRPNDPNSAREITERVEKIRKKHESKIVWQLRKRERFAIPRIQNHPHYNGIIKNVNKSTKFLDAGTGCGWDLRRAIKDGLSTENVRGIDIDPNLIEMGFEVYRDEEVMRDVFEVMDATKTKFSDGCFDIIHSGSVIHGLGYRDKATKYIQEMSRILRKPGGIFFGRTLGDNSEREIFYRTELYISNPEKLKQYLGNMGFIEIDIIAEDLIKDKKYPDMPCYMLHFFAKT